MTDWEAGQEEAQRFGRSRAFGGVRMTPGATPMRDLSSQSRAGQAPNAPYSPRRGGSRRSGGGGATPDYGIHMPQGGSGGFTQAMNALGSVVAQRFQGRRTGQTASQPANSRAMRRGGGPTITQTGDVTTISHDGHTANIQFAPQSIDQSVRGNINVGKGSANIGSGNIASNEQSVNRQTENKPVTANNVTNTPPAAPSDGGTATGTTTPSAPSTTRSRRGSGQPAATERPTVPMNQPQGQSSEAPQGRPTIPVTQPRARKTAAPSGTAPQGAQPAQPAGTPGQGLASAETEDKVLTDLANLFGGPKPDEAAAPAKKVASKKPTPKATAKKSTETTEKTPAKKTTPKAKAVKKETVTETKAEKKTKPKAPAASKESAPVKKEETKSEGTSKAPLAKDVTFNPKGLRR